MARGTLLCAPLGPCVHHHPHHKDAVKGEPLAVCSDELTALPLGASVLANGLGHGRRLLHLPSASVTRELGGVTAHCTGVSSPMT